MGQESPSRGQGAATARAAEPAGRGESPAAENARTGFSEAPAGKSKGGRPRGSKNRVFGDVRARLADLTPKMVEDLYREAHLGYTWNTLKGGSRERVSLTPAERFERVKLLLDKALPSLKAVESVVDQTVRNEGEPADSRQTARAILSLLSTGVEPGGKMHVAGPDETLVRVPKDQARWVGGEEVSAGGAHNAGSEGESADETASSAAPLPAEPEGQIGDTEEISAGTYIQCVRTREGLQWTAVVGGTMRGEYPTKDEARTMAKQMTGHARIDGGFPDERPWPRKQPRVVLGHQSAKGHYRNG